MAQVIHDSQLPLGERATQRRGSKNAKKAVAAKVLALPQTRKVRKDEEMATLALFLFS